MQDHDERLVELRPDVSGQYDTEEELAFRARVSFEVSEKDDQENKQDAS